MNRRDKRKAEDVLHTREALSDSDAAKALGGREPYYVFHDYPELLLSAGNDKWRPCKNHTWISVNTALALNGGHSPMASVLAAIQLSRSG